MASGNITQLQHALNAAAGMGRYGLEQAHELGQTWATCTLGIMYGAMIDCIDGGLVCNWNHERRPPPRAQGSRLRDCVIANPGPMAGHLREFRDYQQFAIVEAAQDLRLLRPP
jgi:hypothetical protein